MGTSKEGGWHHCVLPLLCLALIMPQPICCHRPAAFFQKHGTQHLTIQPAHGSSQAALQPNARVLLDEDKKAPSSTLSSMISRGLGIAHALLESDAEVMALAAAMRSGGALAEGRGISRAVEAAADDVDDNNAEDESEIDSETEKEERHKTDRLKKVAAMAEAVRNGADAVTAAAAIKERSDHDRDAEDDSALEGSPSAAKNKDGGAAQPPEEAPASPAVEEASREPAAEKDALPPWFAQKQAAVHSSKKLEEHGHGARLAALSTQHASKSSSLKGF